MMIRGRFKDGVAVPDSTVHFPDGMEVGIIVPEPAIGKIPEITPELIAEFKFWEDASSDAWEKFLEWEPEAPV